MDGVHTRRLTRTPSWYLVSYICVMRREMKHVSYWSTMCWYTGGKDSPAPKMGPCNAIQRRLEIVPWAWAATALAPLMPTAAARGMKLFPTSSAYSLYQEKKVMHASVTYFYDKLYYRVICLKISCDTEMAHVLLPGNTVKWAGIKPIEGTC